MTISPLQSLSPLALLCVLAGCGGSSGVVPTPVGGIPDGTPVNENVARLATVVEDNGNTEIDEIDFGWNGGDTIFVNGGQFVYDEEQDRFVSVDDEDLTIALTGTGDHARIAVFTDAVGGDVNAVATFLVGDITEVAQMPVDATASYTGGMLLNVTVDGEQGFEGFLGSAQIDADFAAQTVEGAFSFDGKDIVMAESGIVDNTFGGANNLSSETADYDVNDSLVFGEFFGDEAQEVGGTIVFEYTDTTGIDPVSGIASGAFVADQ